MATHATVWSGLLSQSSATLSVGYAVVKNGDDFLPATTANRASYGRAVGIAITATDSNLRSFEYQVAGVLSADVSGVGTGTAGDYVRVTATGQLERVASPGGSDDVIGRCPSTTADVVVTPCASLGGGAASEGGAAAVNVSDGSGGWNEATNVKAGAGYIAIGANPAEAGAVRLSSNEFVTSEGDGAEYELIGLVNDVDGDRIEIGNDAGIPVRISAGALDEVRFVGQEIVFEANAWVLGDDVDLDPQIAVGTGVPADAKPDGSIYLRKDGDAATGIYTRQDGAWEAVGGGNPLLDEEFAWTPTASPNGVENDVLKTFDTSNTTEQTAYEFTIEDETTTDYTATVIGRGAAGSNFRLDLRCCYARSASTYNELEAPTTSNPLSGNPGTWLAVFNRSADKVRLRVKGAGNVRWTILASALKSKITATAPPDVTSITPTSGPELTATGITITGSGFQSGCTVTINGVSCTSVTFVNSTEVTCNTPSSIASGGPYSLVLTNPDSGADTLAAAYSFTGVEFDPATVGTVRIDLDMRFVTTSGGGITVMEDQSGNGHDATPPGGSEPVYSASEAQYNNHPAARFTGIDIIKTPVGSATIATSGGHSPITVAIVGHFDEDETAVNGFTFMANSTGGVDIRSSGPSNPTWQLMANSATAIDASALAADAPTILIMACDAGGTWRLYRNSKTAESMTMANIDLSSGTAQFQIGNYDVSPGSDYVHDGPLCRVIVWSEVLTNAEVGDALDGLGALYGITISP